MEKKYQEKFQKERYVLHFTLVAKIIFKDICRNGYDACTIEILEEACENS